MAAPEYVQRARAEKALKRDIQIRMTDLGMDQKTLAKRLGVPETTVSYWVNHPESLNLGRWQKINEQLKLNPKNFLIAAGFGAM